MFKDEIGREQIVFISLDDMTEDNCTVRLMDNKKGGLDVGYNIQATVDASSHIIIDQYVTNHPTDQSELSVAAKRAQENWGLIRQSDVPKRY